jgi:3-deoxy-D-manno-octulosonic-acid transferase
VTAAALELFVLSLFLNLAYCLLLVAVSPVLVYRCLVHGKYRTGWCQKLFGDLPDLGNVSADRERYWFHAVSVGEVLLLQSILPELRSRSPEAEIVLTTTTTTGHAVAREKFSDVTLGYFPLDFSWAVRRAISRIRPTQIILVELELWPNFLKAAQLNGIPLSLINGRLSEKSFRGYSKIGWLLRPVLQSFDLLAVQNETYAERFLALGARPECLHVTGSAKFDRVNTDRRNEHTLRLRRAFGLTEDEPVFIAGSTQDPEEKIALETWQELRSEFPELRLILVPRHKERFEETARLVNSYGLPLLRRSAVEVEEGTAGANGRDEAKPVILLDTLGELSACWGLADFAYVGGSMGSRGGQNMIEPCAYGAAVCFGPNTRNFRDVVESLLARDAARVVEDKAALTALLREWLTDRQSATKQGIAAREFVLGQTGASKMTIDLLLGAEEPLEVPIAA